MITGFGVHDRPECVFKIGWNRCSRSPGIRVHDRPERAGCTKPLLCSQLDAGKACLTTI